tara:strand:- start:81 stop:503 length:423 start_codon:yes stop_codon:yes gene_type:complete
MTTTTKTKDRTFALNLIPKSKPKGGTSGYSNLTITLAADIISSGVHAALPPQVRCMLELLMREFDGSATFQQLNDAWIASDHFTDNGGTYVQSVLSDSVKGYKSAWSHYFTVNIPTSNTLNRKDAKRFTSDDISKRIVIA